MSTFYDATVIGDGPFAFWELNEAIGPSNTDASGNGHTGTDTGTVTHGQLGIGDGETAVSLSAADGNYILVSTAAILAGLVNFSIEAFVKTTQSVGGFGSCIYAERNAASGNDILKMEQMASGTLQLTYRDDAGTLNQIHGSKAINDGGWHHLVVTKSGTAVILYVDGTQDATGTLTATNTFTNILRCQIGDDPTGFGTGWNGSLAKVALYSKTLSGSQVAAHYAARIQLPSAFPLAPPTVAQWSFVLCDSSGNPLAELSTASSRSISLKRNSYTEVQLTLSHEDDAASLLLSALSNTGVPKLKGYRRGVNDNPSVAAPLRFRGPLMGLQEQSDENSTLTCTFRSPFGVLIGDGDKTGRFYQGATPLIYTATDAGSIAKALIDLANTDSPTGLGTDPTLIVATKTRDRTYPTGQNLGAAIMDLTAVLDGFDFYATYVDSAGTIDAYFNVVPSQGIVNPNARFEYGPKTIANVWSMDRTTTPPVNSVFVTGGNGLTSTYSDTTSVAKYGKWWGRADFSTIIEQATLDDKAKGLVRPNPVKTVKIVPDLALSPLPFDDWNLGDTVPFFASRSALTENTQLRINGFTIPISDDGQETIEVNDSSSPEEDAVIRASLIAEVVA